MFFILRNEERVEEVYFEIKLSTKFDYFQVPMKVLAVVSKEEDTSVLSAILLRGIKYSLTACHNMTMAKCYLLELQR